MKKPSTYKEMVTNILSRSAKSRNENTVLYYHILKEFYRVDLHGITAHELLIATKDNIYPTVEVIGRTSRRIQELNPELRGTEWERRRQLEEPVINDLRTNF
jgi:hypothetical protein